MIRDFLQKKEIFLWVYTNSTQINFSKGPSMNDVIHLEGGSAKKWRYFISLFSKMGDKVGGIKNLKKMGDFIYGQPLMCQVTWARNTYFLINPLAQMTVLGNYWYLNFLILNLICVFWLFDVFAHGIQIVHLPHFSVWPLFPYVFWIWKTMKIKILYIFFIIFKRWNWYCIKIG